MYFSETSWIGAWMNVLVSSTHPSPLLRSREPAVRRPGRKRDGKEPRCHRWPTAEYSVDAKGRAAPRGRAHKAFHASLLHGVGGPRTPLPTIKCTLIANIQWTAVGSAGGWRCWRTSARCGACCPSRCGRLSRLRWRKDLGREGKYSACSTTEGCYILLSGRVVRMM